MKENQQARREEVKRRRKKTEPQKIIKKIIMEISTYLSIITVTVNKINVQSKDKVWLNGLKKDPDICSL